MIVTPQEYTLVQKNNNKITLNNNNFKYSLQNFVLIKKMFVGTNFENQLSLKQMYKNIFLNKINFFISLFFTT